MSRVAEWRRRKAAVEAAHERYRALLNQPDIVPHAAEFARAAETLGRAVRSQNLVETRRPRDAALDPEAAAAIARLADEAWRPSPVPGHSPTCSGRSVAGSRSKEH